MLQTAQAVTGDLSIRELTTFVPSGADYVQAQAFYRDLGFETVWQTDEMCALARDGFRFYLQNLENAEMQNNFMMYLSVADVEAWWTHIQSAGLLEKYPGARAKPPQDYPWGLREIHLIDPAGVLWHIAAPLEKPRL